MSDLLNCQSHASKKCLLAKHESYKVAVVVLISENARMLHFYVASELVLQLDVLLAQPVVLLLDEDMVLYLLRRVLMPNKLVILLGQLLIVNLEPRVLVQIPL